LSILQSFQGAEALEGTLEHGYYVGAFIGICQAVPCILHFENRKGNKRLLKDIKLCVKTQILGTVPRPANWRLATANDSDSCASMKDVILPNSHCRKFVKAYKKLTALCLKNAER
jgi:hypothetical protein